MSPRDDYADYAFVLKLADQPGGMELIGATFAHRGVSLGCSLGCDGALDPEGRATVIVSFNATPAKKEVLRRALSRLSRVLTLVEYAMDSGHLRKAAVFRVAGGIDERWKPPAHFECIMRETPPGESTYLLVDRPAVVDAYLEALRASDRLRDATTTVIGL